MYRQYENPRLLEKQLKRLKEEYKILLEQDADLDSLFEMKENISELEERVNFAWQDEYEDQYRFISSIPGDVGRMEELHIYMDEGRM